MNYETIQGDTWDIISLKMYGSEWHTDELIKSNPEHVEIVIFPYGVKLTIPEIDTVEVFNDLPPWKRGRKDVNT